MRLATLPRRRDCRRRRRHVAATLADGAQARRPYPRRRGARSLEVAVADRGLAQARAGSRRSVQQAQAARRERSRSPIFAMRTAAVPAHLSLWPRAHAAWTSAALRLIRRRATTTDRRLLAPTQNGRRMARAARWCRPPAPRHGRRGRPRRRRAARWRARCSRDSPARTRWSSCVLRDSRQARSAAHRHAAQRGRQTARTAEARSSSPAA